jgi:hypothetical protein
MKLVCPRCKRLIPAAQMNTERDVAVCPGCDEAFVLSDLLAEGRDIEVDLSNPPPGAWFRETFDGWEAGATTRTWAALFLLPFTCVWSGGSLGGIYGMQIVSGKFNLLMSLFGIPFLVGSLMLWGMTIMSIIGRVTFSIAGDQGESFTGAFGFGWRQRFDWSAIKSVKQDLVYQSSRGGPRQTIVLEGTAQPPIRFGAMLNLDRLTFLYRVLRSQLAKR